MGKGEIAHHSVFKRLVLQTVKTRGLFKKGFKIEFVFDCVENIVGKRLIAGYQQFSLSLTMFSKAFYIRVLNIWINSLVTHSVVFGINDQWFTTQSWLLILSQTSPGFYVSGVQVFRKHRGKRRNCLQWAISPFPTVFSTCLGNFVPFSLNLKLSSANSFSLEQSKICCLGKG